MTDMAEVLDEHVQSARNRRCSCGWRGDVSKSIIDRENIYWQHRRHVAAALAAAGFGLRAQALEDLLSPESLEHARKAVEDELIDWRDSGLFMLRNNGLAVRNKDGSGSEIIRFGFEDGLRIAVKDHIARAAAERGGE